MENENILNKKSIFSSEDKQKWSGLIADWEKGHGSQKSFRARLALNHNTFTYMRAQITATNEKAGKLRSNEPPSPR